MTVFHAWESTKSNFLWSFYNAFRCLNWLLRCLLFLIWLLNNHILYSVRFLTQKHLAIILVQLDQLFNLFLREIDNVWVGLCLLNHHFTVFFSSLWVQYILPNLLQKLSVRKSARNFLKIVLSNFVLDRWYHFFECMNCVLYQLLLLRGVWQFLLKSVRIIVSVILGWLRFTLIERTLVDLLALTWKLILLHEYFSLLQ